MRRISLLILLASILAFASLPAHAQPVVAAKSGLITGVWGDVTLDGEAQTDALIAQFPFMKENGVLSTAQGRAEVAMNPGVMVRLGENATLRLISSRFIDTRAELVKGSVVVQYPEILKDNAFTLVLKDATITFPKAGDYRFDTEPARVKVFAGEALVELAGQRIEVGGGKMLDLTGGVASVVKFNREETDALDRWSASRAELQAKANLSAAKQIYDSPSDPCYRGSYSGLVANPCTGSWRYNPWYGIWTYIPVMSRYCDVWGNCYYSPRAVAGIYYPPRPMPSTSWGGGGGYQSVGTTSSGSSGAVAASSGAMSSSSAGSGSSAGAAAASSSVGRGSSGGGSRGQ